MTRGDNCSSSCLSRDHATWGECVRAKSLHVGWAAEHKNLDATLEKKNQRELKDYAELRSQGIQPEGTSAAKIRQAELISQHIQAPFTRENVTKHMEKQTGVTMTEMHKALTGDA